MSICMHSRFVAGSLVTRRERSRSLGSLSARVSTSTTTVHYFQHCGESYTALPGI
jgi:hypothetical protein